MQVLSMEWVERVACGMTPFPHSPRNLGHPIKKNSHQKIKRKPIHLKVGFTRTPTHTRSRDLRLQHWYMVAIVVTGVWVVGGAHNADREGELCGDRSGRKGNQNSPKIC